MVISQQLDIDQINVAEVWEQSKGWASINFKHLLKKKANLGTENFLKHLLCFPFLIFSYVDFSKQIINEAFFTSEGSNCRGAFERNGILDFWKT